MLGQDTGNLFIVAAPSGGGKTSLVKQLISSLNQIEVSISHTTRAMRPGEIDGVDYFFVDTLEFTRMIEDAAFLEHAEVFNHLYGTSKAQIHTRLKQGIDVVLDIDWQGAKQIKNDFPEAVSVFIIPPSLDELQQRLLNRKQDKDEVIKDRMVRAKDETSHFEEFDYLIVNENFDEAYLELRAVVVANRLKTSRQKNKQKKLLSLLLA